MIELAVVNREGNKVDTIAVDEAKLGGKVNAKLLRQAVIMYEANRRVGTHSTKDRGEVSGSTRKLYRQKGTGFSRSGSRKSPIRRGGGVVHGPKPRDYTQRMPRAALRRAAMQALLSKLQQERVVVLDEIVVDEPRTRIMVGVLKTLGLSGRVLVLTAQYNRNVTLSARNIPGVEVRQAREANARDFLLAGSVLMERGALEMLSIAQGE